MSYGEIAVDGIVPASGTLSLSFGPKVKNRIWTVGQISTEMAAAPIGCTCKATKLGRLITFLVATGDTAGAGPPVQLSGSETIVVTWTGATPGTSGHLTGIYDETTG